jgi:hypothetical protein
MLELLIATVPFTYTFGPSLSPALLKACTTNKGIDSQAWDLSADFNHRYSGHEFYDSVVTWLQNAEMTLTEQEFDWYTELVKGYAAQIKNTSLTVALSLLTQNSQRFAEDLAFHIKQLDSDIKIIIGGNGIDILQHQYQKKWHELMLNSGLVDLVILGEGEFALADAILNDASGVITVPQLTNRELDLIPVPDYSDYNFDLYPKSKKTFWSVNRDQRQENDTIFLITASKGCVKNCNFCDVGKIWSRFRFRSGESVANEMIELNEKYGATYFSFTDSLLNGGLKTFFDLNQVLVDRLPNKIRYEGQMICRNEKDMPEKYFKAMATAGCFYVSIGMESGSESVRMHMGKGSSQEDIAYTTQMLIKYNIKQNWNIIAGYITETDEDWQQTMSLLKHWLPRANGSLLINPIDTFMLLDGTPMSSMLDELQISTHVVNGYHSFAWTSNLNPTNTYTVRANRFIELCEYLILFDLTTYGHLQNRIDNTKKKLSWYKDDTKKVYSLSQY